MTDVSMDDLDPLVFRFIVGEPPDGRTLNSGRNPNSQQNWHHAVHIPSHRQPNRGLTDESPWFTCTRCSRLLPMEEAHRVGEGLKRRRTGWCLGCGPGVLRANADAWIAEQRGPDYVLPEIKDQTYPVVDGHRECCICSTVKPIDNFYKEKSMASGYQCICIPCAIIRKRSAHMVRTYGLTQEEYDQKVIEQDGVCAICKKTETALRKTSSLVDFERESVLSVDHDHETGAVRGLLCHRCNMAIGYAQENPEILRAAIEYLAAYTRV